MKTTIEAPRLIKIIWAIKTHYIQCVLFLFLCYALDQTLRLGSVSQGAGGLFEESVTEGRSVEVRKRRNEDWSHIIY